jgi:hypothetical protein
MNVLLLTVTVTVAVGSGLYGPLGKLPLFSC